MNPKDIKTVVEFKTVSPLFEMERDGIKPFTTREYDYSDPRFQLIGNDRRTEIKITNPANGESFTRTIKRVSYVEFTHLNWINIHW